MCCYFLSLHNQSHEKTIQTQGNVNNWNPTWTHVSRGFDYKMAANATFIDICQHNYKMAANATFIDICQHKHQWLLTNDTPIYIILQWQFPKKDYIQLSYCIPVQYLNVTMHKPRKIRHKPLNFTHNQSEKGIFHPHELKYLVTSQAPHMLWSV